MPFDIANHNFRLLGRQEPMLTMATFLVSDGLNVAFLMSVCAKVVTTALRAFKTPNL